ncbi:JAB domain-containing protein [Clostridium sp. ZS2-4]|uniref:JAB domain-containing protein n=1 Tax=Clostridium sp. ZS2-4 TaxID=2987703 RepID=UPI00227B89A9|nr:JAB domain-containing protein [Clostridium sp. ZS2-4]MCY6356202.1 DNA repair protein [Clostridium sp. ZS2-4]
MKNKPHTESFLKGLTTLTGLSMRKVKEYAKDNSPFNILEHPRIIEPNEKQLQKIGLLNEFIASYNLLKSHESENKIKISSPEQAGAYFVPLLSGKKDKEKFMVAFLDAGNNIIHSSLVSEGTVSQAIVYPREILKQALACDCKSMIIAHNHPGGAIMPSAEDKNMTQRLVDIFYPLEIRIHDHIIVADTKYTSMAEKGYMPRDIQARASYEPFKIVEVKNEEKIDYSIDIEEEEWELE